MDPMRFKSLGPSKDMSFLCTHVFQWTQKPHVYWWTQKIIKGPLKDMRFWGHQKTWGFGWEVGPSKDMRFYKGKLWKHMYQLGPSKDMRFWKGKILIWVHQKTWGFWVHQKTWGGEKWAKFGRVHQKTWVPILWMFQDCLMKMKVHEIGNTPSERISTNCTYLYLDICK